MKNKIKKGYTAIPDKDRNSLETKKQICVTLSGKKDYKNIIKELEHIENIANFQKKRINSKIENQKDYYLTLALVMIERHIDIINDIMEKQKCMEN